MKRLLSCLIFAALPLSAEASTELARQWGLEAGRLSAETSHLILAVDMGEPAFVSDRYALDIYRFGRTSADLAQWIDASDGPNDLGCIFRGMAAESETQLTALESSEESAPDRENLRRLASMFADAEMIAVAAQIRAPAPGHIARQGERACPADAGAVLQILR
ncbi:MAG: hypothetical protein AAGL11_04185 [Pseudomonadota bacterium]